MGINWRKSFSKNFIYYYLPESMAEKNLSEIKNSEENLLIKLEKFLEIKNPKKINLYIYPSLTLKKMTWVEQVLDFPALKEEKLLMYITKNFLKWLQHMKKRIYCALNGTNRHLS